MPALSASLLKAVCGECGGGNDDTASFCSMNCSHAYGVHSTYGDLTVQCIRTNGDDLPTSLQQIVIVVASTKEEADILGAVEHDAVSCVLGRAWCCTILVNPGSAAGDENDSGGAGRAMGGPEDCACAAAAAGGVQGGRAGPSRAGPQRAVLHPRIQAGMHALARQHQLHHVSSKDLEISS